MSSRRQVTQDGNRLETLKRFRARTTELRESKLWKKGFSPGFTLSWNKMRGFNLTIRQPDETDLRAYLMTFRLFMLNEETIYLYKIYKLCLTSLSSDQLKSYLAKSRSYWTNSLKRSSIPLAYNGKEITPEFVIHLFLNGYYFHNDPDKERLLKALLPHEYLLTRHQFLDFVARGSEQVFYVDNIINFGLREGLFR